MIGKFSDVNIVRTIISAYTIKYFAVHLLKQPESVTKSVLPLSMQVEPSLRTIRKIMQVGKECGPLDELCANIILKDESAPNKEMRDATLRRRSGSINE
jgi:hypothetical protein